MHFQSIFKELCYGNFQRSKMSLLAVALYILHNMRKFERNQQPNYTQYEVKQQAYIGQNVLMAEAQHGRRGNLNQFRIQNYLIDDFF